jgi:hypothetical protein
MTSTFARAAWMHSIRAPSRLDWKVQFGAQTSRGSISNIKDLVKINAEFRTHAQSGPHKVLYLVAWQPSANMVPNICPKNREENCPPNLEVSWSPLHPMRRHLDHCPGAQRSRRPRRYVCSMYIGATNNPSASLFSGRIGGPHAPPSTPVQGRIFNERPR